MKTRWLDRRIAHPGPYLTLCLSDAEYQSALRPFNPSSMSHWLCGGTGAATHQLTNANGESCCIVCVGEMDGRSAIEIAGLLVHEAVHVWQKYCECIGERNPGIEQEAYAIQSIAQELFAEYARRTSQ